MSPQLSPEQFLWMTLFLFPWRTMLPVIMWWNGMMPPAGRTVLWTGSRWPLQTNSPLLNQVCQSPSQLYMGRGRVHPRMRHQVIAGPYVSIWATLPCSVVPRQCPEGVCVPPHYQNTFQAFRPVAGAADSTPFLSPVPSALSCHHSTHLLFCFIFVVVESYSSMFSLPSANFLPGVRYNISLYCCSSETAQLLQRWQGYMQELGKGQITHGKKVYHFIIILIAFVWILCVHSSPLQPRSFISPSAWLWYRAYLGRDPTAQQTRFPVGLQCLCQ